MERGYTGKGNMEKGNTERRHIWRGDTQERETREGEIQRGDIYGEGIHGKGKHGKGKYRGEIQRGDIYGKGIHGKGKHGKGKYGEEIYGKKRDIKYTEKGQIWKEDKHKEKITRNKIPRGGNYTERRHTRKRRYYIWKTLSGKGTIKKGDYTGTGTTWGRYCIERRLYGKEIT